MGIIILKYLSIIHKPMYALNRHVGLWVFYSKQALKVKSIAMSLGIACLMVIDIEPLLLLV